ncbi:MAG: Maf family protein [Anaerolineales bacterium]
MNLTNRKNTSPQPSLILASMSPRRQSLMDLTKWAFVVIPADVDETPLPDELPQAYVLRLAEEKARGVAKEVRRRDIIIAADTTVADQGRILGKPQNAEEARAMLQSLRGRSHQVFTALAVYQPSADALETDLAETDVPMREYSDQEIEAYIASGDPFDKAGSYAIQHPEFKPVEYLSGCYANVVGLPLCHLSRTLRKFDLLPQTDLPKTCQAALNYQCEVFELIDKGDL